MVLANRNPLNSGLESANLSLAGSANLLSSRKVYTLDKTKDLRSLSKVGEGH